MSSPDLVKGKHHGDGLSVATWKQKDMEIMQHKQKKANEEEHK